MATGPLPRRSKLSELIRSPFRSSTLHQEDNDWYIPYDGPIEPPRLSLPTLSATPAFDYSTPQRRDRSPITLEAHRDSRIIGPSRDSSSSKRAHKAGKPARKAVISLDTGGIGESPATVLDEQSSRRSSAANLFSSSHSHKDPSRSPLPPPAVPYVVNTPSPILLSAARHPFNPHGFDNNCPSLSTSTNTPLNPLPPPPSPLITSTAILPTVTFPPSLHTNSTTEKHPYSTPSANTFSRIDQVWPTISVNNTSTTSRSRAATILSSGTVTSASDRSIVTGPLTSERNASEWGQHQHLETLRHRTESRHGRVEQHFTGSSGSTSVTSSAPRDRDHHFSPHHTLMKSRSTPQSLSASHYNYLNTNTPAYPMHTHPYALSPIPSSHSPTSPSGTPLGFNGKPPIPRKSFGVLQRLRATASAPNLQNGTKQAGIQAASHSHTKGPAHSREHKRSHVPPRINITPPTGATHDGMAHELPITLVPASSMQAVAHPRPRFISAPVPPEDPIPSSPYPLSKPQFPEFDDTDRNMFAQCLPLPAPSSCRDRVKEVKDGKGSTSPGGVLESPLSDAASFKSKDVEKTLDLHRGGPRDHEDDGSEDEADEAEKRAEIRRRRERDEALAQAVRDNELLTAERERWEKHAHRSLGNKRSRSLSMRGKQNTVRRTASQGAIQSNVPAVAGSRSDAAAGHAPNGRHRATTVTSGDSILSSTRKVSSRGVSGPPPADSARSRSATLDSVAGPSASVSSLRYLASAAFGHTGHSTKMTTDSNSVSGGRTSLLGPPSVTHSNTAAGAAGGSVSRRSATSGSRSGSMSDGHSRGSSADTRQIAVATVVRLSQAPQHQDYDTNVMDIRDDEDNSVRAAVEQRIGLALSPSPELMARSRSNTVLSATSGGGIQHPYASPSAIPVSLSSRAGPHPTTAGQTSGIPFKDDVATRHRLPPQVIHAHKRSLSTGNSASSIAPAVGAAASASPPPSRRGKASAPPASDISDHPFMASSETFLERPSSGRVEVSFQEALVASTALSEWPGPLSAELRDGDPDPFRRNPVAVVPTNPPGTPHRRRTRSHGASSASNTTPPRRQPSTQSTSRNQPPIPPPVATSTPLKRRSRSMSDIKTRILGRSTSSSENVCSRPVSPTRTFGPPDSPTTSHAHAIQANSPEYHASQTSGGVSPPTESSIVSIVNPEILLHEGRDDLEEFRDLFYRPNMAHSTESSPRGSLRVDAGSSIGLGGRPLSGTSALWNSLGPVFSEHFEMESGNVNVPHSTRSSERRPSHGSSDRNRRSRAIDKNGE